MKQNLKNRPYLNDMPDNASKNKLQKYAEDCVHWFEGLKEELQQLKQKLEEEQEQCTIHSMHDNVKGKLATFNLIRGKIEMINKILGEK